MVNVNCKSTVYMDGYCDEADESQAKKTDAVVGFWDKRAQVGGRVDGCGQQTSEVVNGIYSNSSLIFVG